jgi:hypothetical protein
MLGSRLARVARLTQNSLSRAATGPALKEQLATVKDVKVKEFPQWASEVQKDPKTKAAVKASASFADLLAALVSEI